MSRGKRSTWDVCLVIFVASADALEDWCWRAFAARIDCVREESKDAANSETFAAF